MVLKDKVVFLLTFCEAEEWIKFNPADVFNTKYSEYSFIVLDNGNQPQMEQWCKETNSFYYGAEYNIGSSGGYNWIFRVASLLKLDRAILLQADVEILDVAKVLDVLLTNKWQVHEIPFWPQVDRSEWDTQDNPGQVYNLGQIFSFNPNYLIEHDFLVDENYVVTHFDDADLARRMRDGGMKLYNQMLNLDLDCLHAHKIGYNDVHGQGDSHVAEGYYIIHHISSSSSGNHKSWLEYNQNYHNEKWYKEVEAVAWMKPFGDENDLNYRKPHSLRWTKLGYPPYPVEHEVNRFHTQWNNQ